MTNKREIEVISTSIKELETSGEMVTFNYRDLNDPHEKVRTVSALIEDLYSGFNRTLMGCLSYDDKLELDKKYLDHYYGNNYIESKYDGCKLVSVEIEDNPHDVTAVDVVLNMTEKTSGMKFKVNHPLFEISNRLILLDENSEAFDVEYYLDVHLDSGKVKRYLLEVGAHSYVEEDNFDTINVSSNKVEFIIPIDKHTPAPDLTDKSGRSLKRIKYALHLVIPDGESIPIEFTDKLIEKGHINVLRIAPIGNVIHGNPDDYIMIRPNHNKEDKTDEL